MSVNNLAIFVTISDDCYQTNVPESQPKGGVRWIEKWILLKRKPLELVVLQGGGRGGRHSLTAPHVVLGRLDPYESPAFGNLLFPEPTVSRVHATLDWDEGANRYLLTHRSATNATLINKAKVTKPRHIAPGDKIQMGNLILEIRVGIGQHAEVELEAVDFTALTKQAANQVYRPESVMPEAPAIPAAGPQPPQEAPIPAPIPPPARRNLPPPVFHEPYAPVEVAAPVLPAAAAAFFEFPEADEQVSVVQEAPRRIQLSNLPLEEEAPQLPPTDVLPAGLFATAGKPDFLPLEQPPVRLQELETTEETLEVREEPATSETEDVLEASEVTLEKPDAPALEPVDEVPLEEPVTPAAEPVEATEAGEPEEKPKSKPFRRETRKIGRNEKCPCGSGKKYKKCCGAS